MGWVMLLEVRLGLKKRLLFFFFLKAWIFFNLKPVFWSPSPAPELLCRPKRVFVFISRLWIDIDPVINSNCGSARFNIDSSHLSM